MFRVPSAALGNSDTTEALLGTVPVRVDFGPSREVTLSYEVDEYGDLTVSAQYKDNVQTKNYPMRYLRPFETDSGS